MAVDRGFMSGTTFSVEGARERYGKEKNYDKIKDNSVKCRFQNREICQNTENFAYTRLCQKHNCYYYQKYIIKNKNADAYKHSISKKEVERRNARKEFASKVSGNKEVERMKSKVKHSKRYRTF